MEAILAAIRRDHAPIEILFHVDQTLARHLNGMRFSAFDGSGALTARTIYFSVGGDFIQREGDPEPSASSRPPVPYPFSSGADLMEIGREHGMPIWQIMLEDEKAWRPEAEIRAYVQKIWEVMQASVQRGLAAEGILPGGLLVRRRAPRRSSPRSPRWRRHSPNPWAPAGRVIPAPAACDATARVGIAVDFFKRIFQKVRGYIPSGPLQVRPARHIQRFPMVPRVIDTYVLSSFLFYFAVWLASFVFMTHVYTFFELLSDIVKNRIPMFKVLTYLFFLTPRLIYDSTPVSVLVAVLITFGVLSKHNEVTAFKACGISLYRLASPVLVMSVLLSATLFAFDHYYVAQADRKQDALRNEIKGARCRPT